MTPERTALAALLLAAPMPAAAQATEVRALLDTAMDEQRVFLTCSATNPAMHALVVAGWQGMVADTLPLLAQAGLARTEIDAFARGSAPAAMLPPEGTHFDQTVAYCRDHGDWARALATFAFTYLPDRVQELVPE